MDLVIQVQAQRPTNLDSALQVAQHMEAVMRAVISKSSKPVRTVVQDAGNPRVEVELRDLTAGQSIYSNCCSSWGGRSRYYRGVVEKAELNGSGHPSRYPVGMRREAEQKRLENEW